MTCRGGCKYKPGEFSWIGIMVFITMLTQCDSNDYKIKRMEEKLDKIEKLLEVKAKTY